MSLTLSLQQTSQVGQIRSNRVDRPPSREPIGERITYSRPVADCTQPGGREIRTDADSTPLTGLSRAREDQPRNGLKPRVPSGGQGLDVAGVVPVDVGAGVLVVGVWVLVVGALVGDGVGTRVGVVIGVGTRVGVVVIGVGVAFFVVAGVGTGFGCVGIVLTGVGLEGKGVSGAGRTRK